MKTISIIIPFFNEGANVRRIYDDITKMRTKLEPNYCLEILYMDNHSTDDSHFVAQSIAKSDASVRLIRLSRNFGYQANILTGYLNCLGDAAVQLDCDGEDNPDLISEFVREWEAGFKVVYGIRCGRAESFLTTLQRKFFYRIINRISKINLPVDAGDFRLIDRCVIEELRKFGETTLYIRGLISYIGFEQKGIKYDRRRRFDGKSKFGWLGSVELAWTAIASFSSRPLLYVAYPGVIFSAVSIVGGFGYLVYSVVENTALSIPLVFLLIFLFLTGVQLFGLGIVGSYVGRVFEEVKQRPRSIIEFDSKSSV